MAKIKDFLSTLKKSPVTSNVVFSFILIGLEKIVEWEFECPCDPKFNAQLASAFFVVPTVLVYLMITVIQEYKRKYFCLSIFSASVWLCLVFMDGKYFSCAMTHWPGEYVTVSGSSHFKWCKPFNETLTEEYLKTTQFWFTVSQSIGIWTIIAVPLGYEIYKKYWTEKGKKNEEPSIPQNMEASSVSVRTKAQGYTVSFELQPQSR